MITLFKLPFALLFLTLVFTGNDALGQSLTDQISAGEKLNLNKDELFTEKVQRVSDTKKIFILTNTSAALEKGDFFTILLGDNLACRALAAKSKNGVVGIKILKIYSLKNWNRIRKGSSIQILKGDDNHLFSKAEAAKETSADPDTKIESEDDLYNEEAMLTEGLDLEENKNRIIKTDNIITASSGTISGSDVFNEKQSFSHWGASWSYQLADNFWGEGFYGYSSATDFPNGGLNTTITNFSLRLKYTIKAPFYSYILPYIGYQILNAESPGAGNDEAIQASVRQEELDALDELSGNSLILGVTILKRLVPGWFAKLDLGTDSVNLGVGIEF